LSNKYTFCFKTIRRSLQNELGEEATAIHILPSVKRSRKSKMPSSSTSVRIEESCKTAPDISAPEEMYCDELVSEIYIYRFL
jgi:hypothetical protein